MVKSASCNETAEGQCFSLDFRMYDLKRLLKGRGILVELK
jgi:hypothetical protein